MRNPLIWLPPAWAIVACGVAWGQGTAVQLPTYSYFTTNSTVVVPDRGSVYLGGVQRARSGANSFGVPLTPLRNRPIGRDMSASSNWVSVFIHDFAAMDEFLLSQPTATNPNGLRPTAAGVVSNGPPAAGARADSLRPPAPSVAELRARRLRETEVRDREAVDFFQRGRTAEAAGKAAVARIYYHMAARRAGGEMKAEILARLELLGESGAGSKIALSDR